jgi:hypothetical protein
VAPNTRVAEVYWSISNASIRGILVRIRTALADLVAELTEFTAATTELDEAVNDPVADKGRMRRAVHAVMGYLKLASNTALTRAAITAGNQAGNELDLAIRHIHL